MAAREADTPLAVLPDALGEVRSDTGIEGAVSPAGHDVDSRLLHTGTLPQYVPSLRAEPFDAACGVAQDELLLRSSDEAIQSSSRPKLSTGLLRYARNDGEGFYSRNRSISAMAAAGFQIGRASGRERV